MYWKIPISINQFFAGCGQKGFVYGNVIGLNLQCQSLFWNGSVSGLCCHDLVGDINKVPAPVRRRAFMATLTITKQWWFWTTSHWIDVRKAVKTIERVRWRCHFRWPLQEFAHFFQVTGPPQTLVLPYLWHSSEKSSLEKLLWRSINYLIYNASARTLLPQQAPQQTPPQVYDVGT